LIAANLLSRACARRGKLVGLPRSPAAGELRLDRAVDVAVNVVGADALDDSVGL
jgi:hypothetical protein